MSFLHRRSPSQIPLEGTLQREESSRRVVLFLYHGQDCELWSHLAPHISTLVLRLHRVGLDWKYYTYALPQLREEQDRHEAFVSHLQTALLFPPCTSADFLSIFWHKAHSDARIGEALSMTQIQPIPLRAAYGVSQSLLPRPFAAYAAGPERDEAAVQIIAGLEKRLLSSLARMGKVSVRRTPLLAETGAKVLQLL